MNGLYVEVDNLIARRLNEEVHRFAASEYFRFIFDKATCLLVELEKILCHAHFIDDFGDRAGVLYFAVLPVATNALISRKQLIDRSKSFFAVDEARTDFRIDFA